MTSDPVVALPRPVPIAGEAAELKFRDPAKGRSLAAGTAKHRGLVPNFASRPNVGTTWRLALVMAMPIISCGKASIE